MKFFKFFLYIFLLLGFTNGMAQTEKPLYLDVAQSSVDVTTGFEGAEITVFGAINETGDLAITLKGPLKRVILRRKESTNGLWMNRTNMDFRRVPLFYDYAVSKDEQFLASEETLRQLDIGINYVSFDPDSKADQKTISEFQEALIRTQQEKGNYSLDPRMIHFSGSKLFRTNFYLPQSVPMGRYTIEAILMRGGKIIEQQEKFIEVKPKGISAMILFYATNYSFVYALIGLGIAISAGLTGFFMLRRDRI
jgi:uncharacterized protein (TIGR02186 family)